MSQIIHQHVFFNFIKNTLDLNNDVFPWSGGGLGGPAPGRPRGGVIPQPELQVRAPHTNNTYTPSIYFYFFYYYL